MIGAGELTEIVRVERLVETEDDDGNREPSWKFVEEIPARVDQLRGDERQEATNSRGFQTHKISMRFSAGVKTKDRLVQRVGPDEGAAEIVHNVDEVVHDYQGDSTVARTVVAS